MLSYTSGKGETQSVPVAQLTKVDVADPTRLEFLISTSVGGGRDFLCRAATQAELAYWVGGLTAHMAAEAARQAAVARRAAEDQVAEMEAQRVAEAQRRRASGASRVARPSRRGALMCALTLTWGLRLTYNFARKGGFSGGEDYRWAEIRTWPGFDRGFELFNLLFIWCATQGSNRRRAGPRPERAPHACAPRLSQLLPAARHPLLRLARAGARGHCW